MPFKSFLTQTFVTTEPASTDIILIAKDSIDGADYNYCISKESIESFLRKLRGSEPIMEALVTGFARNPATFLGILATNKSVSTDYRDKCTQYLSITYALNRTKEEKESSMDDVKDTAEETLENTPLDEFHSGSMVEDKNIPVSDDINCLDTDAMPLDLEQDFGNTCITLGSPNDFETLPMESQELPDILPEDVFSKTDSKIFNPEESFDSLEVDAADSEDTILDLDEQIKNAHQLINDFMELISEYDLEKVWEIVGITFDNFLESFNELPEGLGITPRYLKLIFNTAFRKSDPDLFVDTFFCLVEDLSAANNPEGIQLIMAPIFNVIYQEEAEEEYAE